MEKTGDESDPIFAQLQDASLWKGAVTDSNVAAQQDGLASYCAFLQFGGSTCCARYLLAEAHDLYQGKNQLTRLKNPWGYGARYC